jgi:hypothetical protein
VSGKRKKHPDIVGTWVRAPSDDTPYPHEITFAPDGIYSGKMAPGSRSASKLDVGVFDRIDEKSIRMSTSTDRDETFALDVSDEDLKLVDEAGQELAYKRRPDHDSASDAAPRTKRTGSRPGR